MNIANEEKKLHIFSRTFKDSQWLFETKDERSFSSTYMKHSGGKFSSEVIPVRHYCDEDYPDAFKLSTEAFHEMRVSVEDFPDSKVGEPSKQSRDD